MDRSNFDRKKFNSDFDKFDRRFDLMSKFVGWFIGIVFALLILWYLVIGVVFVKSYHYVDEHGVKSLVERVWEGNKNGR